MQTQTIRIAFGIVCGLAILSLGSGCATNRGILDVRISPSPNPQSRQVVKITKVTDLRNFELKPTSASTPSLKDGQITDKSVTSRAIARKRNGYGKALGDILLPEGRTVENLVQESVQKALRDKGYSVLEDASTAGPQAIPVEVDIHQFWAWFTPGFWAVALEFESVVTIKSPVVLNGQEETVKGSVRFHSQMANTKAWMNTIQKGIEDLIAQIKAKTKNP